MCGECFDYSLIRMYEVNPTRSDKDPLFIWPEGTQRKSDGVDYPELMCLLKQAAVTLGSPASSVGLHSIRRGAAQEYLMCGGSIGSVQLWGRWASDAVMEYVTSWDSMMKDVSLKVVRGQRCEGIVEQTPLSPRHVAIHDAQQSWQKFVTAAER